MLPHCFQLARRQHDKRVYNAGMVSGDMQQEQGRRDWEEEAQRRYELEQIAEAARDQRVDVSLHENECRAA